MSGREPKFSITEIVLITPYYLLSDAIGIILVFFGVDDFFILDAIRFPVSQIYLRIKGVAGTATLVSNLLEVIPYVGALPCASVGWFITIYIDRHPESIAAKGVEAAGRMKKIGSQVPEAPAPTTL